MNSPTGTERGCFIAFEGGEGSGKSTQSALLAAAIGAVLTREPGGTPIGERIRAILLDPETAELSPRSELLLMAAARAHHVASVIRPALFAGQHVVCDRYSGSTLAYQGYGRGIALEDVNAACAVAEDGVTADLTVLLDIPVELGRDRIGMHPDRIEQAGADFHTRVVEGFRSIAATAPERWAVVSGLGTPEEVADRVRKVVTERLGDALVVAR